MPLAAAPTVPAADQDPGPEALPDLSHVYRVEVPRDRDLAVVLGALRADPHVEYAQLDHPIVLDAAAASAGEPSGHAMPPFDDPFLTASGSWGQPYADLWGLERVGAPEVWAAGQGEGVVVAVVDSGLDRFHPDIAANVWVNPGEDLDADGRAEPADENGRDDDGNGFVDDLTGFDFANSIDLDEDGRFDDPKDVSDADPFDDNGHGTHVSGTIAAVAGNGIGIVGVAPRARIMALKGFPEAGPAEDSTLWRAVLYAAENGAHVINNSWSCGVPCPDNPLADEVLALVEALGVVVVTSAGNASEDVVLRNPENGDRVVTVGSIGFDDRLSRFSNRGYGIDLVAPGGGPSEPAAVRVARRNILSLLTRAIDPDEEAFSVGDDYWRLAGTSMAAPHVAGAVAILRADRPELTPRDVRRLLGLSARDLGSKGHDRRYGTGALDLPRLLATPLPDLRLRILSPKPGAIHDPADGALVVRGVADGRDLARIEVAVARGLSGDDFEPLAEAPLGASDDVEGAEAERVGSAGEVLARWDVSAVSDGPHVIRVRGQLVDDTIVDELRVVAIERNPPLRVSSGMLRVGAPALSGRHAVWPVAEDEAVGAPFDLAIARIPVRGAAAIEADPGASRDRAAGPAAEPIDSSSVLLLARTGSQEDVAFDRRLLAWRSFERAEGDSAPPSRDLSRPLALGPRAGARRLADASNGSGPDGAGPWLEWCRVGERPTQAPVCAARRIRHGAGDVGAPHVGRGWIVWQRTNGIERTVEGCFVGAGGPVPTHVGARGRTPARRCRPRPLVADPEARSWRLRSFDGRRLLLEAGGTVASCRLTRSGSGCVPRPIERAPGTPRIEEPIHDGQLLAFSEITLERRPAPGCLPSEDLPECPLLNAVVRRHYACWVDWDASVCDATPISTAERVEAFTGLDVSARRVTWSVGSAAEGASLRFCEFDPRAKTCEPQRLTGSVARVGDPAIDGRRLVWLDERAGPTAVWAYTLPDLRAPGRVRAIAGRRVSIPLRVRSGSSGRVRYAAEWLARAEGGDAFTGARLRIIDRGRPGGLVHLVGRLPRRAEGRALLRIHAEGAGGLTTGRTIEVVVRSPTNVSARSPSGILHVLRRWWHARAIAYRPDR